MRTCCLMLIAALVVLSGCGGGGGATAGWPGASSTPDASKPPVGAASQASTQAGAGLEVIFKLDGPNQNEATPWPLAIAPFTRANTYRFLSGNGKEQVLRLDFEHRRYELLGANASTAGTFEEDPGEPGTFILDNARTAGNYNTARFRLTGGAVIGAFPVPKPYANPTQFETLPFIAVNDVVTDGADIDGNYSLLETSRTSLGMGGGLLTMRISGGGALMTTCTGGNYWPDACPEVFRRSYVVSRQGDAWHATANTSANPRDDFDFRIARIAGEKVYVDAGTHRDLLESTQYERTGLRIGMPSADFWPQSRGKGTATGSAWGVYSIDGYTLTTTAVDSTGQQRRVEAKVSEGTTAFPSLFPPIRTLTFAGSDRNGYAMQNNALLLAWAPAGVQAGLSIALASGVHPDVRTGDYTLFGVNGRRYLLRLNLEGRAYSVLDALGAPVATGAFRPTLGVSSFEWIDPATSAGKGYFTAANDAMVGSIPLPDASSGTTSLVAFVAARSFLTTQAELSALSRIYGYWLMLGSGAPSLPPVNQSIDANGTSMQVCMWMFPVGVSTVPCPPEGIQTLSIVPAARPGAWLAAGPNAQPGTGEEFYVARIGGDLVYLSAAGGIFKIGLDISPSAPAWKTMSTAGINVATNSPWAPSTAQFSCMYTNLDGQTIDTCYRFLSTQSEMLPMNSGGSSTGPARTITPGAGIAYTIHQGRSLLVMRKVASNAAELGIGMTW